MLLKIVEKGDRGKKYMLRESLLYRANKLCVLASYVRLLILHKAHGVT
jgi:hypothetical protein